MIENEAKFLLRLESLTELIARMRVERLRPMFIRQCYLADNGARLRTMVTPLGMTDVEEWHHSQYDPRALKDNAARSHTFTYKIPYTENGLRQTVEINSDLSPDIHEIVFRELAKNKPAIYKLRFSSTYLEEYGWDIDLFYSRWNAPDAYPGFVLGIAECEMPKGQVEPKVIPEWLQPSILRRIGRDETRLNNSYLVNHLERMATTVYAWKSPDEEEEV